MSVGVRRSVAADASIILDTLIGDARFTFSSRHGPNYNISHIIETSFLSVTAFMQVEEEDRLLSHRNASSASASDDGTGGDEEERQPPKIVEKIVGFAAFSDAPRNCAGIDAAAAAQWPQWIKHYASTEAEKRMFTPDSTFWLSFIAVDDANFAGAGDDAAAASTSGKGDSNNNNNSDKKQQSSKTKPVRRVTTLSREIVKRMLDTALATVSSMQQLLFALPTRAVPFSPICSDLFRPLIDDSAGGNNTTSSANGENNNSNNNNNNNKDETGPFAGTIFTACRNDLVPDLQLRQGRIEDYDDLMPLLLAGAGVVTPLQPQFRLEELLKNQDDYHQVVVAEDPATKRVVAVMCLKGTYDQQQYVVKQYQTDIIGKFKQILSPAKAKGQQAGHNAFRVSFFFLHPDYDVHAGLFIPKAFSLFPFAEYCFLSQPHANTVHPVLRHFVYFPIKKLPTSTIQGESVHLPEGLFICCRYVFESTPVLRVADATAENGVAKLLATQSELPQEAVETLQLMAKACVVAARALKQQTSAEKASSAAAAVAADSKKMRAATKPTPECFIVCWRDMIVGVVSGIRCTVDETFALRANFNIDKFVSFEPYGDMESNSKYQPSDISARPFEAPKTYYKDDMPGFVIKGFYVRPVFREKVRFMLREVLRQTQTEVLYAALSPKRDDAAFPPLLQELVLVPPRRVAEIVEPLEGQLDAAAVDIVGDDAAAAASLVAAAAGVLSVRCSSRRLLSDEKTVIHARVVVVGASTTGLSVLHTLLHVPYLHFTNLLLVSTDGMPAHPNSGGGGGGGKDGSGNKLAWVADYSRWTEREYLPLSIGGAVRVVTGSMVDVDRVDKCVFTDNPPMCEPYDHLILAVGRQYSLPKEFVEVAKEASAHAGQQNSNQHDGDDAAAAAHMAAAAGAGVPSGSGIFVLKDAASAEALRRHIRETEIYEDERSRAVVYGSSLDVYAIVTSMLELGMAPQRIVILSPDFSAADVSAGGQTAAGAAVGIANAVAAIALAEETGAPFGDVTCAQRVETLLEGLGVQKLRGFGLKRLEFDVDGRVCHIVGETPDGQRHVELEATMLVYAGEKDIDIQVLSALNKRSIVFDGRVIVENTYRTTDRDIYAAGPIAMFSRRFGPSTDFDVYDPAEVGEHLAKTVLGCLGVEEFVYDELVLDGDIAYVPKDNPLAAALGYEQAGDLTGGANTNNNNSNNNNATTSKSGGAEAGSGDGTVGPRRPRSLPKYNGNLVRRVKLPGGISFFSCTSLDCATVLKPSECENLASLSLNAHIGTTMTLHGPPSGANQRPRHGGGGGMAQDEPHDAPLAAEAHESGLSESCYLCVTIGPTRHIERVLYLGTDKGLAEMPHLCNIVGMSEAAFNLHYNFHETKAQTTTRRIDNNNNNHNNNGGGGAGLDLLRFFRMVRTRPLLQDHFRDVAKSMHSNLLDKDDVARHIRAELLETVRRTGGAAVPDDARRRAVALLTDPSSKFRKLTETLLAKFLHDQKQFNPQTLYLPDLRLLLDAISGEPRIPEG